MPTTYLPSMLSIQKATMMSIPAPGIVEQLKTFMSMKLSV